MNTGIQDSISLAETLAITLQDGDEARLDSWAARRHKIAKDVVALTDRMTRVATMKSPTGQALRNMAVAFVGHLPWARAAVAKTSGRARCAVKSDKRLEKGEAHARRVAKKSLTSQSAPCLRTPSGMDRSSRIEIWRDQPVRPAAPHVWPRAATARLEARTA